MWTLRSSSFGSCVTHANGLRRRLIVAGAALALVPSWARPEPGRTVRIGFLGLASGEGFYKEPLQAFRAALRELGYVEGKNLAISARFAEDRDERLPGLAAELTRAKLDLIVSHGTQATQALRQATTTIPIVMAAVGDPIGARLVSSLARPGGNITGLTNIDVGLAAKRLELLKEVVPQLSRVAVLYNSANPSARLQMEESESAAGPLGVELRLFDVRASRDLEAAFAAIAAWRADALDVLSDPTFLSRRRQIAALAAAARLPSVFARRENVAAGGLMSYGTNLSDQFREVAVYVDKVLKGARPGDLPIGQAAVYQLAINIKTARALGLAVSKELIVRAHEVIE